MGRNPALPMALVLVAVCTALALSLTTPGAVHAGANCETAGAGLSASEQEMFDLINAARAAEGLSPLVISPGLNRTAAWKSADRSAWGTTPSDPLFSHKDSLGRMPTQRANDCGFPKDAAENIAYGWGSARATFDAWMASSGHRANILMSYYVTVGIGEHDDRWTANFGIFNDGAAAVPAPAATVAPAAPVSQAKPAIPQPPKAMKLGAGATRVVYAGPGGWSEDIFGSLGSSLEFVYTWDGAHGCWLRYVPGEPSYVNSLAWIEPGVEVIVGVTSAGTWEW